MKQYHYVHVCFPTDLKIIFCFLPFTEVTAAIVIWAQIALHFKETVIHVTVNASRIWLHVQHCLKACGELSLFSLAAEWTWWACCNTWTCIQLPLSTRDDTACISCLYQTVQQHVLMGTSLLFDSRNDEWSYFLSTKRYKSQKTKKKRAPYMSSGTQLWPLSEEIQGYLYHLPL